MSDTGDRPETTGGGPGDLVRTFIRHPNAANLLMILMILIGVFSILKINAQFFPSVDRPRINISITWSGASAEDIERNILVVIEPEVRFTEGVDEMTSTAREGSGFDPAGVRRRHRHAAGAVGGGNGGQGRYHASGRCRRADGQQVQLFRPGRQPFGRRHGVGGGQAAMGQAHPRRADRPRHRQDRLHRPARSRAAGGCAGTRIAPARADDFRCFGTDHRQ